MLKQNQYSSYLAKKSIKILSLFLFAIMLMMAGCSKDNDETENDPISGEDSYLSVKLDGNLIESSKVVGGSLSDIMQFFAHDESGNPTFIFTIYKYSGTGEYNFDEDIVIRTNGGIYQGNESTTGKVSITYDNQLAENITLKGEFYGTLPNLLDDSEVVSFTEGKFQASQD